MYRQHYGSHRKRLSLLILLAMLLSLALAACQPQAAPADSGQAAAEEAGGDEVASTELSVLLPVDFTSFNPNIVGA